MERLQLGVPGQIMPPADAAVRFARRAEADGFDAVWWPDHLMGWHPDTMWTPDLTPLARVQDNPHTYFDPLIMMGVVGAQTERIKVGVVVTDLIRRNPAMAAASALTLDHVTKGRAILGLGSGEKLNVTPYGMEFDKPVARLSEGIDVMRLLWDSDGPVDYRGTFHTLEKAVLGLRPYGDRPPEIWTAAHGPRMLRLTGTKADGWLPTKMTAPEYGKSLTVINQAAQDAGRDPAGLTPGMLGYVLMGPDAETVRRLTEAPLVRALCVLLPAQVFRDLGVAPPLEGGPHGSGFHDFIPTTIDRAESLRIIAAIPPQVVRHYAFCGTPAQVAEELAEYRANGLRHLVMWNITAFGDPSLAKWSFGAMAELKQRLA
ncbi:LLM class flavin-dependent oxidoreductase [Cryptosporangium aurantiacum]|uniref:Phthiodiolone/phenolphthiodiolone dimycocerosates ketoreductase n=1 Tax=Cryptosporangium aurantiacum TaxID=134849 RepID=A0A1M7R0X4_9ACTN|nr:LLM class flavin-dependent oxidoreductase [Cryptosporangium aurantiacum]SHN38388.1 phthiodiolone/phenolphthiodiolone dimycocerosates ketoreductase [Cryptosporangium aurantiacum]